ncbi:hypothetical protein BV22DRAFT_562100 [Leucogyrophana mollusca]|uniref:Uncharacterized protein n=1 Tax=Leucogyrophana mollusca TaxID=85980 RepID=A0ACB8BGT5_9AGAM|nr:hypothetical protein BV22DRAFT_562100 [Leucogyrophana mollusca]
MLLSCRSLVATTTTSIGKPSLLFAGTDGTSRRLFFCCFDWEQFNHPSGLQLPLWDLIGLSDRILGGLGCEEGPWSFDYLAIGCCTQEVVSFTVAPFDRELKLVTWHPFPIHCVASTAVALESRDNMWTTRVGFPSSSCVLGTHLLTLVFRSAMTHFIAGNLLFHKVVQAQI